MVSRDEEAPASGRDSRPDDGSWASAKVNSPGKLLFVTGRMSQTDSFGREERRNCRFPAKKTSRMSSVGEKWIFTGLAGYDRSRSGVGWYNVFSTVFL